MESGRPGNLFVAKATVVFVAVVVIVAIWWSEQSGGRFDEGCGPHLEFLYHVGELVFFGSIVGLVLSVITIKLGFSRRGWFTFVCSLLLLVYFIFFCRAGVC